MDPTFKADIGFDKYSENRTPEEFADYLFNKLNSCKPSYIAQEIEKFALTTNKQNLKEPQAREMPRIKAQVISELNKKTSDASFKSDQNKGGAQDSAFWNQSKVSVDLPK